MPTPGYHYLGTVNRVVDGDTVDVDLDLGFHIHIKIRCRVARINAPEMSSPEGKLAKGIVLGMLPVGKTVYVDSTTLDRYGRSIAELTVDNKNLTDMLIGNRPDLFLVYK